MNHISEKLRAITLAGIARGIPALFIGGLIGLFGVYYFANKAPVVISDFRELDGIAVRGGALDMHATVSHARSCITEVRRWLWRDNPDQPGERQYFYLPGAPFSPPLSAGTASYTITVPVPFYVPVGEYHYLGQAIDDCPVLPGILSRRPRLSPDALVQIINAPASPAVP